MKETEHALIGAMVGSPSCIPDVMAIVSQADFSTKDAAVSFLAISNLFREGCTVDPVTVGSSNGVDFMYIAQSTSVGFWTSAKQYALDIAENSKLNRIRKELSVISQSGSSTDMLRGITDVYNSESGSKGKAPGIEKVLSRFDSHVKENVERGSMGLNTGIDILDSAMIYYVKGQIWTMGGYTSTGKTAMMVQMVVNLFRNNSKAKACIVSTEMTEAQMVGRILGNMTGIYSLRILSGELRHGEEEAYALAYEELKSWDLKIHDDINEISDIESTLRSHSMRGGIDVVYIDYVQNCKIKGVSESYMEQKTLATSFQQLAKVIDSTLVCLSQVSNAVGRGMVDTFELKGAGEWAAVTDVGILLKIGKINPRELAFAVPKNRHGVKPNVVFNFSQNYSNLYETGEKVTG